MKLNVLLIASLSLIFISCFEELTPPPSEGIKPIYGDLNNAIIESKEPRTFGTLGKIVTNGSFIYLNERFEGIHVVDNSDPKNPQRVAFWCILGNSEFTIEDNYLYADNSKDMLVINISDPFDIKLENKIKDIYTQVPAGILFPSDYSGVFECVDTTKGIVIGWESAFFENPECWR